MATSYVVVQYLHSIRAYSRDIFCLHLFDLIALEITCMVKKKSIQWFFHFGEDIVIAYRVSTVDVPESPITSRARGP